MARSLRGEDVVNATFTQTQFREGYDEAEVDDLLDEAGTLPAMSAEVVALAAVSALGARTPFSGDAKRPDRVGVVRLRRPRPRC